MKTRISRAISAMAALLVLPGLVLAAESQQAMKERVLEHIDAKIRILQTAQSCVRAATDTEDMMACHAQERKQMRDLRDKDRKSPPPGSGSR
jgi:hypothetical protein